MTPSPTLRPPLTQLHPDRPIPILFVHYGDNWVRGSEQVLLDLLAGLDRERFPPLVWCNAAAMEEAVAALCVPVVRSEFAYYFDYGSSRFNVWRYLSLVREGVRLARRHSAGLIHANGAAPNQWMLPVARVARIPLLAHLHIEYLRRSRVVCLLRHADFVVGVAEPSVAGLRRDGMAEQRLAVIYNGIDFARFAGADRATARRELGIEDDGRLIVLAVGSLIKRKGHDILLRAFARVHTANAMLMIAAEGPEQDALQGLADELGIRPRVRFLGQVEHWTSLASLYRACDVMALASRSEGAGLVFAEAGYFGRPVVATDVGGNAEIVEHEITGLLVPPDDVPAIAAALGRLLADAHLRTRLGDAAAKRVRELFGLDRMTTRFAATYQALGNPPQRARP